MTHPVSRGHVTAWRRRPLQARCKVHAARTRDCEVVREKTIAARIASTRTHRAPSPMVHSTARVSGVPSIRSKHSP